MSTITSSVVSSLGVTTSSVSHPKTLTPDDIKEKAGQFLAEFNSAKSKLIALEKKVDHQSGKWSKASEAEKSALNNDLTGERVADIAFQKSLIDSYKTLRSDQKEIEADESEQQAQAVIGPQLRFITPEIAVKFASSLSRLQTDRAQHAANERTLSLLQEYVPAQDGVPAGDSDPAMRNEQGVIQSMRVVERLVRANILSGSEQGLFEPNEDRALGSLNGNGWFASKVGQ
jgi:hypothetical protein